VAHGHYGTALRALKKLADEKCYDGSLTALSLHTAMVELADQLVGMGTNIAKNSNELTIHFFPGMAPRVSPTAQRPVGQASARLPANVVNWMVKRQRKRILREARRKSSTTTLFWRSTQLNTYIDISLM
jgi:hypothetical protein